MHNTYLNFVLILSIIRVLHPNLAELKFELFSLSFCCSLLFTNNWIVESQWNPNKGELGKHCDPDQTSSQNTINLPSFKLISFYTKNCATFKLSIVFSLYDVIKDEWLIFELKCNPTLPSYWISQSFITIA